MIRDGSPARDAVGLRVVVLHCGNGYVVEVACACSQYYLFSNILYTLATCIVSTTADLSRCLCRIYLLKLCSLEGLVAIGYTVAYSYRLEEQGRDTVLWL